jgi:hypothetical protein
LKIEPSDDEEIKLDTDLTDEFDFEKEDEN